MLSRALLSRLTRPQLPHGRGPLSLRRGTDAGFRSLPSVILLVSLSLPGDAAATIFHDERTGFCVEIVAPDARICFLKPKKSEGRSAGLPGP